MLFASYRRADYADSDGFIASLAVVLAQYPEDVVLYVTRPETGIQRVVKFPPTIPEVVEACDNRVAEIAKLNRFKNWGSSNTLAIEDRSTRLSLQQMQEKYGPNWGLDPHGGAEPRPVRPAPTADELAAHYAEYGLQFKPKKVRAPSEEDAA